MGNPGLSSDSRKELLRIARRAIEQQLEGVDEQSSVPDDEDLLSARGNFVSLHKKGALRGCIGVFTCGKPLYQSVQDMALSAAFEDPRFPPLRPGELKDVDLEISVLSPLERISDPAEVQVGKHGVYIVKGFNRGVLLPQVATEQGWDRETFLEHTCLKAGLPPDAWRGDVEIYVFTAEVFGELDRME